MVYSFLWPYIGASSSLNDVNGISVRPHVLFGCWGKRCATFGTQYGLTKASILRCKEIKTVFWVPGHPLRMRAPLLTLVSPVWRCQQLCTSLYGSPLLFLLQCQTVFSMTEWLADEFLCVLSNPWHLNNMNLMVQVQSYFLGKWRRGFFIPLIWQVNIPIKSDRLINSRAKLKPFKRCCVVVAFLLFFITYPSRHLVIKTERWWLDVALFSKCIYAQSLLTFVCLFFIIVLHYHAASS